TRAHWKSRNFGKKGYAGETLSGPMGRGGLTITPIQLANAIGGLAMGGIWHKPHLVKGQDTPARVGKLDPENVQKVIDGMYGVVNEAGTGVRAHLPGIAVCGKTGSAQVASNEFVKSHKMKEDMKDNSWFVGFAQCNNPEIVVAALFQGGEHGMLAAPIVRDVIKAYYDKKARLHPGETNTPGLPRRAPAVAEPPAAVSGE